MDYEVRIEMLTDALIILSMFCVGGLFGYILAKREVYAEILTRLEEAREQLPKRYDFVLGCMAKKFEDEKEWFA